MTVSIAKGELADAAPSQLHPRNATAAQHFPVSPRDLQLTPLVVSGVGLDFRRLLVSLGRVAAVPVFGIPAAKTRSRRDAWLRDELILALALYKSDGPNPSVTRLRELSDVLRALPIETELAEDPTFRSVGSVRRKLGNFKTFDPNQSGGLTHTAGADGEIWSEFADTPVRLEEVAYAIRAATEEVTDRDFAELPPEVIEAEEGHVLTRLHISRERNSKLVATKKNDVLRSTGALACEVCGFDFAKAYGERGIGFAECHHRLPVSTLVSGQKTRLVDLAIVCSNCHRMIHRARPWLTTEDLRDVIRSRL